MSTRRQFIRDFSCVAAAAVFVPAALAKSPMATRAVAATPGLAEFAAQVNTPFLLRAGAKTVELKLMEANHLTRAITGAPDADNEKFSLLFRGAAPPAVEQDIHCLEHSQLGRLSLFLVPVGRASATHCDYEAIFNRPVDDHALAAQLSLAPRRIQKS